MGQYANRSVSRALALLEALRDARGGMGLTVLAERTSLDVSTAFRLLAVLVTHRYVHLDATSKRYSLGYASFRLAQPDHVLRTVRRMGQRYMAQLAQTLQTDVMLAELHGMRWCLLAESRVYAENPYGLRVGGFADAHATALGKILLAHRPAREVEAMYEGWPWPRHTPQTVGTLSELRKGLPHCRHAGHVWEHGEYREGVTSLAVPLMPPAGGVRFALGLVSNRRPAGFDEASNWVLLATDTAATIVQYVVREP